MRGAAFLLLRAARSNSGSAVKPLQKKKLRGGKAENGDARACRGAFQILRQLIYAIGLIHLWRVELVQQNDVEKTIRGDGGIVGEYAGVELVQCRRLGHLGGFVRSVFLVRGVPLESLDGLRLTVFAQIEVRGSKVMHGVLIGVRDHHIDDYKVGIDANGWGSPLIRGLSGCNDRSAQSDGEEDARESPDHKLEALYLCLRQ